MNLRLHLRRYRLPFRQPLRTGHGWWVEREGVIVRLQDERGREGYGEAAPVPGFGSEDASGVETKLRGLGKRLSSDDFEARCDELGGCAAHALRAAWADLAEEEAEAQNGPEYLPVAALLPAGEQALRVMEPKAELGFRTFKWKVGVADPQDERAMLLDLLAVLPKEARLRLDANGAWNRVEAERWLTLCAEFPMIEWVEQPVAAGERGTMDLMLGLGGDYPTKLALDESLVSEQDVDQWINVGWPGVWVIKPALWGDASQVIARLAQAKADVVFSSALETAVGARTLFRFAFAWPGKQRALGTGVWPLYAHRALNGPTAMPFVRWDDVKALNAEAAWNALN